MFHDCWKDGWEQTQSNRKEKPERTCATCHKRSTKPRSHFRGWTKEQQCCPLPEPQSRQQREQLSAVQRSFRKVTWRLAPFFLMFGTWLRSASHTLKVLKKRKIHASLSKPLPYLRVCVSLSFPPPDQLWAKKSTRHCRFDDELTHRRTWESGSGSHTMCMVRALLETRCLCGHQLRVRWVLRLNGDLTLHSRVGSPSVARTPPRNAAHCIISADVQL